MPFTKAHLLLVFACSARNSAQFSCSTLCVAAVLATCASLGCRTFCPRSLEQNVVDARAASLHGLEAMEQENWNEAERIFAGAVKACPSDERARSCYAETL